MALTKEDLISISYLLDVKLDAKFTAKLRPLEEGISDIKSGIERLEVRVDRLETRVAELDEKVESFGVQVRLTRLEMENTIGPQIQLLSENYVPAAKRYEKASDQIDEMLADIDIMKHTITRHSEILQRLA